MNENTEPELLTPEQVAELLQMPKSTVLDHARRGILPVVKIGKHRRFWKHKVLEALGASETNPSVLV